MKIFKKKVRKKIKKLTIPTICSIGAVMLVLKVTELLIRLNTITSFWVACAFAIMGTFSVVFIISVAFNPVFYD